jgi:hypothetical protein
MGGMATDEPVAERFVVSSATGIGIYGMGAGVGGGARYHTSYSVLDSANAYREVWMAYAHRQDRRGDAGRLAECERKAAMLNALDDAYNV